MARNGFTALGEFEADEETRAAFAKVGVKLPDDRYTVTANSDGEIRLTPVTGNSRAPYAWDNADVANASASVTLPPVSM